MKKKKTLETKLRTAIRLIWSRSPERNAVKKAALFKDAEYGKAFNCPLCGKVRPEGMGQVDHVEAVGPLVLDNLTEWVKKMFFSEQSLICDVCHKAKTKEDRKRMRNAKS